jgi:hypothetical protein
MSALGHKRTLYLRCESHVRFTPKSGHVQCTSSCPLWAKSGHPLQLFDYLVGASDQCIGNVDAECLGGFEIDDKP